MPDKIRGIYLLPNLLTTLALFGGFYAIIAAQNERYHAAAIAVFVAMILDGLDGRIARLTNTQSEFGAEYDSFSDLISFGLAPSLVMYQWSLVYLNSIGPGWAKLGWLAAFIYTATTAMRLAMFNVKLNDEESDPRYFSGLPSPSAAALMIGLVWMCFDFGIDGEEVRWLAFLITITAGLLMVSNVRYPTFKEIDFRQRVPLLWIIALILIIALVAFSPPVVLFTIFLFYTLSGIVISIRDRGKKQAK